MWPAIAVLIKYILDLKRQIFVPEIHVQILAILSSPEAPESMSKGG